MPKIQFHEKYKDHYDDDIFIKDPIGGHPGIDPGIMTPGKGYSDEKWNKSKHNQLAILGFRRHEDGYNFDEQYYTWQDYEDAVREAYNEKPHKRIMEGTDESIDLVDYFFKTTLCIEALFYREGNAGLWQDAHHYSENKNDIILLLPKLFPYFITEFMRLYYAEIPSHGKSLKESRDAYV